VANKRVYSKISNDEYERKLRRVMERLDVQEYRFDYSRFNAWVQFTYKGGQYHFEHSPENARVHDQKIEYGSDCFVQIVYSLEDIARMVERGIYDLSVWVSGMKMLPAAVDESTKLPACFVRLGFTEIPESEAAVDEKFKRLTRVVHPDSGGDNEGMKALIEAREQAKAYLGGERS
jgi:hypothetical protein